MRGEIININNSHEAIYSLSLYKPKEHNRLTLRECKYCKKKAESQEELQDFVSGSMYKFGKRNICKDCYAVKSYNPSVNIVGQHSKLTKRKSGCPKCGSSTFVSSIHNREGSICQSCRLLERINRARENKPKTITVIEFNTKRELEELSDLLQETNKTPEEFIASLKEYK